MTDPTHPVGDPTAAPAGKRPTEGASFEGRTPRKAESLRAGMIVGTGLLLALGAAVAMGASPAQSASSGTSGSGTGMTSTAVDANGPLDPERGGRGDHQGRGFGQISITAIDGSTVSLATEDGWTRTITVTDATTITRDGEAATLGDLSVGDTIRIRQTRNDDGKWTVNAIGVVQPKAAGTVTAIDGDSITITRRDGTTQTITTTDATTYRVGRADGTRSDVVVGATIVATGEEASDGTLTATTVAVRIPRVLGTVTATTADTLTLSRRDGTTVTVHVNADTTIRVAGVATAKLSDVKTGMVVGVAGTQRADGSIDAQELAAGEFGKGRGRPGFGPKHDANPDASTAPDASAGTDG